MAKNGWYDRIWYLNSELIGQSWECSSSRGVDFCGQHFNGKFIPVPWMWYSKPSEGNLITFDPSGD